MALQIPTLAADSEIELDWQEKGSVFQYTSFTTFRSMLGGSTFSTDKDLVPPFPKSGALNSLWATSSLFLNDSKEFFMGKDLIESEIKKLPRNRLKQLMHSAIKKSDGLEVYCACFSAVDDDLSQWRGYGADGAGVCLEFDLEKLLGGVNAVGYWVIYGKPGTDSNGRSLDEDQRLIAGLVVKYVTSTLNAILPNPISNSVYDEVRERLAEIWPTLSLAFKHLDFHAEKEFRLVYSEVFAEPAHVSFRPNPIIPFVRLTMEEGRALPIKSVRLGPAVSSPNNLRSTELALKRLGLTQIVVKPSDIPYVPR